MFGITVRKQNRNLYDPWQELEELERAFWGAPMMDWQGVSAFRTDVSDQGDHYLLEADLPGFDKKEIQLELNDDVLTVFAQRKRQHEKKEGEMLRRERSFGAYSRSFDISGIDADKIKAKYENGVLRLTLPKLEHRKPKGRRLEIQ